MADETFDAVIIGGGSKALVTAVYLQTYGGMKVGIFERMHELGGSWCSLERLAPGFIGDTHSSTMADFYFLPLLYDFPNFEDYGGRFFHFPGGVGLIMKDNPEDCLLFYSHFYDPSGELTAKEIARYSEADAETFLKFDRAHFEGGRRDAVLETIFSLPPPPGQPTALDRWYRDYLKQPDAVLDENMLVMTMLQAGRALFESIEYRTLFASIVPRMDVASAAKPLGGGLWFVAQFRRENNRVMGGTHNIAHAVIRIFVENGGKFFSNSEVDKIIIEDEQAKGIRLVDGTEIRSRIVVSGQDPHQLAFRFIGKEHLDRKILMKVASLERDESMINWYTFAVHELPNYTAATRHPIINETHSVHIAVRDDAQMTKEYGLRYAGVEPAAPQVRVFPDSEEMKRAPKGKYTMLTETLTLPLQGRTEREWLKYKMDMARYVINEIHSVAPNITWDSVIGVDTCGPYDIAMRHLNMPTGNQLVIDCDPAQRGRWAPIREWANHRIPGIKNLYATGAAWGVISGANACEGYKCYKAIAEDLELRKPWEEKNRPW